MEGYAFREEELCHCWFSVLPVGSVLIVGMFEIEVSTKIARLAYQDSMN